MIGLGVTIALVGLAGFLDEFRNFNRDGSPAPTRLGIVVLTSSLMGLGVFIATRGA